jgi:hypothetical protein
MRGIMDLKMKTGTAFYIIPIRTFYDQIATIQIDQVATKINGKTKKNDSRKQLESSKGLCKS